MPRRTATKRRARSRPNPASEPRTGPPAHETVQLPVLGQVWVDGALYPLVGSGWTNPLVSLPGVAAGPDGDPPEIASRLVPFHGHVLAIGIALRQDNHLTPVLSENGTTHEVVRGITRYVVSINGKQVFSRPPTLASIPHLLAEIAVAIGTIVAGPVRWWDVEDWQGRRLFYHGVPCAVLDLRAGSGEALLKAAEPYRFPDRGAGQQDVTVIDILDPTADWLLPWTDEDLAGWRQDELVSDTAPAGGSTPGDGGNEETVDGTTAATRAE